MTPSRITGYLPRLLLLLLLLLLMTLTGGGNAADNVAGTVTLTAAEQLWLKEHPVITLAPDPDFKPIEYFDKNGAYQGAAADIIRLLEKKLGISITIARLKNWDEAMEKFKNHEVDLLGAMVRTPNREKFALFTETLVAVPGGIFARSGSPTNLTLKDLKGKKVAVVSNYAAHDIIKNQYPDITLEVVPDVSTGLAKASLGMVDVYVENMANATFYSQEAGITNLQLAGKTEFDYRWGIGIRKDWPILQGILNKGLAAISEEERNQSMQRWIYIEGQRWRPTKLFIIGAVAASLGILLLLVVYWNYSLRTVVRNRTASLQDELRERQKAETALKNLTGQLEERVKERTMELQQEIGERTKSEQVARESEQRFRELFENITDPIYIADMTGKIIAANEQACRELGYSRDELLHLHIPDIDASDDITNRFRANLEYLSSHPSVSFESIHQRKDGSQLLVELNVRLIDFAGQAGVIGVARNITSRKQVEEAIKASDERFRSIMALSPDIISIISADGTLKYNSPASLILHGYSQEEMLGVNTFELIHPDDQAAVNSAFQEVLRNPALTVMIQYRYRNKDGSYAWMECSANNQLANPHINGVIAISRNIDARKALEDERLHLEQQLLHAQKLESLGVLAGGIAHDFNNILTAIIGNAELALMRLNPESPVLDNLERIEKAAARAADLARQMLAYSGKGKFVVEHIDLNRLVAEMGHMLEVSISKKAVLRYNLTTSLPAVNVDATQIRQIIMNLVINASEAIGDQSGVIAITTGCLECNEAYLQEFWLTDPIPEGLYVSLEIADTGCGMDKGTLEKIFDPFFTTKFTGRGLGMAAVLGIVRGHKGAIKVYSEPGKGSSFKVLLPAGEKPAELFNDASVSDSWRGCGVALLVDDEETVRAIGGEMLRELGFEVITATDGRDAVAKYSARNDICLVIMDLTMPHMDGEQCFRELRQVNPDVKVIMSSGFSEHEVTQKFAGKGLAGFVQKPYKMSALRDAMKKALS